MKKMKIAACALSLAICFAGAGCINYIPVLPPEANSGSTVVKPSDENAAPVKIITADKDLMDEYFGEELTEIISRVRKSVVSVVATYADGKGGATKRTESGVVMGFIDEETSGSSFIVISHHLIVGASSLIVYADGDESAIAPRLVGTDPQTDLCVLKIDKKIEPAFLCDLPVDEETGESLYSSVGKSVLTVADTLGINMNVVSRGIISAENYRYSVGEGKYEPYYLTDAYVGEYSSGGGLFSENGGMLMGIINGSITEGGWRGFVLPVSTVRKVCSEIVSNEDHSVSGRYKLGFTVENVSTSWGLSEGVKFTEVSNDGSFFANGNGLRVGDVVKSFKFAEDTVWTDVSLAKDFYNYFYVKLIDKIEVGAEINFRIERNGTQSVITIKIQQYKYFSD